MNHRIRRYALALTACLGALTVDVRAAMAHETAVRGVVLTVLPSRREAVVRNDAGGPTATTVVFRLGRAVNLRALHPGDRILARVLDTGGEPEIADVRIVATGAPPPVLRTIVPLDAGDQIPATRFVDQNGRPFTFGDFAGTDVVLAFIYTRCRDARMCPLISSNFEALQQRIGARPYHLVEITLDPAYDRPAVLARYARGFDADRRLWTLGTGDARAVLDFAARFGIEPFADPRIGLIHTERTVLIDRSGKIVDFIDEAGWSTGGVLARLAAIEGTPENPLARLDYELSKAAVAVCGNAVAGFSGLGDLAIVLLIIGGAAWLLLRLGRRIFREQL